MIACFGEIGAHWQQYFENAASDVPVILVEDDEAQSAISTAFEWRRAGRDFDLLVVSRFEPPLPDGAAHEDYDVRRRAFDGFAGRQSAPALDMPDLAALRELVLMARRILVRSWHELRSLRVRVGLSMANVDVLQPPVFSVPRYSSGTRILVWAADCPRNLLAIAMTALEEIDVPVDVLGADATPGVEQLLEAGLIVCASPQDAIGACSFAAAGYPVLAPDICGAAEWNGAIATYSVLNRRSIVGAVLENYRLPARPREQLEPAQTAEAAFPATVRERAETASIIVRTQDRPKMLRRALASLRAQTYPAVEIVLVSDNGPDMSGVAEEFGALYLKTDSGRVNSKTANVGFEQASGAYTGLLDDDDALFPDHLELLIDRIERAGTAAVHGESLVAYVANVEGGDPMIAALGEAYVPSVSATKMLALNQIIGSPRVLFRRDLFRKIGYFDENLVISADYEYWLRIAMQFDFAHAERVTSLYSWFRDASNFSQYASMRYIDNFEYIYAKYPAFGRPYLKKQREHFLAAMRKYNGLLLTDPHFEIPPLPFF